MADPDWCGGNYYAAGKVPRNGLAVARMAAHITYLSEEALHRKFGRSLQDRSASDVLVQCRFPGRELSAPSGIDIRRSLRCQQLSLHHARNGLFRSMREGYGGVLANAFRGTRTRFCVVSFTSDWLYPTRESREIVQALNAVAANVSFVEIESDKGHDAFLLEEPTFFATMRGFLNAAAVKRGLGAGAGAADMNAARRSARSAASKSAARRPRSDRRDGRSRRRACLTSDAVTESCCSFLPSARASTAAASRLQRDKVNACVAHGLSVIQGDADRDLDNYPDQAFDYAILSLTIQATRQPKTVLENLFADRPPRHRLVSEFRPLAGPHRAAVWRAACR